jgi:hypothetical protein
MVSFVYTSSHFLLHFLFPLFLHFHLQLAKVSDGKVIPATATNGAFPQKPQPLNLLQVKFVMMCHLFSFFFRCSLPGFGDFG